MNSDTRRRLICPYSGGCFVLWREDSEDEIPSTIREKLFEYMKKNRILPKGKKFEAPSDARELCLGEIIFFDFEGVRLGFGAAVPDPKNRRSGSYLGQWHIVLNALRRYKLQNGHHL